jgi:DNA polymerase I-like protein with 3'-5' exonuclease and polymerase domains
MLNIYAPGQCGDMHSLVCKMAFPKETEGCPVEEIKKKFHKLRDDVKSQVEFPINYGGDWNTIREHSGKSDAESKQIYDNYMKGFPGIAKFQNTQKKFVVNNGYILISPITGHKAYWWDWKYWKKVQASYTSEFWDEYRAYHKGTGDEVARKVSKHFKAKTKWEKNACNSPLQGAGAVIFKRFNKVLFDWIVDNGYFNIIKFCIPVHDEINVECPVEIAEEVKNKIQEIMKEEAQPFLKTLTLESDASVSDHWIH